MKPVWMGQGEMVWLEPETEEEKRYLESCPKEWSWEEVLSEWSSGLRRPFVDKSL